MVINDTFLTVRDFWARNMKLRLYSHYTGSIFGSVRKSYHFQNRGVPVRNRHRNCAGPSGSNVYSRPIRYCLRGSPIINPVQCEHGLIRVAAPGILGEHKIFGDKKGGTQKNFPLQRGNKRFS